MEKLSLLPRRGVARGWLLLVLGLYTLAATTLSAQAATASPGTGTKPAAQTGKIYGEFQDKSLYEKSLKANPEMKTWTDQELWDGLSGATMQTKDFGEGLPECTVWLGKEQVATADSFGQFWVRLPAGTYTLTGKCAGYRDTSVTVTVEAGGKAWVNFVMPKK